MTPIKFMINHEQNYKSHVQFQQMIKKIKKINW